MHAFGKLIDSGARLKHVSVRVTQNHLERTFHNLTKLGTGAFISTYITCETINVEVDTLNFMYVIARILTVANFTLSHLSCPRYLTTCNN